MAAGAMTATVTAKTGPGLATVAASLTNVTDLDFHVARGTFEITWGTPSRISIFEYSDIATITWSPSGATVTIST